MHGAKFLLRWLHEMRRLSGNEDRVAFPSKEVCCLLGSSRRILCMGGSLGS
ncbi:hypothetical protein AAG906_017169 [Vitis piasezkii]